MTNGATGVSSELDGKAKEVLGPPERDRLNRAIREAESKTSAEIMPVLALSSGRYERAEDIVGLWAALLCFTLAWLFFQGIELEGGGWAGEAQIELQLLPCLVVLFVGFVAGVVVAGRSAWLRRLFVPRREMRSRAVARAKTVFFDRRLHRTAGATGVLVYVSLFEQAAVVLTDDAVAEKLSERALEEVRDEILETARGSGVVAGLVAGIERLGSLLAASLPAAEDDSDEVSNEVVILE